jgi:hypothetical protein
LYEVPLDPVTCTEAALDAATFSESDCPAEMLLELAVMETEGTEAVALAANAEIARKLRRRANDGRAFMGPALCRFIWDSSRFTRLSDRSYPVYTMQASHRRLARSAAWLKSQAVTD